MCMYVSSFVCVCVWCVCIYMQLAPMHHRLGVRAAHMPIMKGLIFKVFEDSLGENFKSVFCCTLCVCVCVCVCVKVSVCLYVCVCVS